MKKRILLALSMLMLWAPMCFGLPGVKTWTLYWDSNTEADLKGYYLYWKLPGAEFADNNRVDMGMSTSHVLNPTIPTGTALAVTAYDTSDNESEFSLEVLYDKDPTAPAAPTGPEIRGE